MADYAELCAELKAATKEIRRTEDLQYIMPLIGEFETSGFPDDDFVQRDALRAVADIIDAKFGKVWYDMIRYDTMRCDAMRCDAIRYDMIGSDVCWFTVW